MSHVHGSVAHMVKNRWNVYHNYFYIIFSFFSGKKQAQRDLLSLWTSLDVIRIQVLAHQTANDEMKTLCNFFQNTSEYIEKIQKITDTVKNLNSIAKEIYQAMENTRHTLPIEGTNVDNDLAKVLKNGLSQIEKMVHVEKSSKMAVVEELQKLMKSLEISLGNSEEAKSMISKAKSEALREASMKLSLRMAEENQNEDSNLIELPPLPKLIDF